MGQGKLKRMLTREDYKLWSVMTAEQLSENGNWCSYSLRYESGNDTLFAKRTDGKRTVAFPKGRRGVFNKEKWFACIDDKKELKVCNLSSGRVTTIKEALHFQWVGDAAYLMAVLQNSDGKKSISIRGPDGIEVKSILNIATFSVSPSGKYIAFSTSDNSKSTCGLVRLGKSVEVTPIVAVASEDLEQAVWEKDDKAFAFVTRKSENADDVGKISLYAMNTGKLNTFDAKSSAAFPEGMHISSNTELINISPDLKKVFFGLKQDSDRALVVDPKAVQIWNAADKWLYPLKVEYDGGNIVEKVAVWFTDNGTFTQITSNVMPRLALNNTGTHAIVHDPQAYEPQAKFYSNTDYYLVDLETGTKELLLADFTAGEFSVVFSSNGKYVSYFKNNNWWIYDVSKKNHTNVTERSKSMLYDDESDESSVGEAYGRPMWSADGAYFLFYDQYDLWKVSPDGQAMERMTLGREKKLVLRLSPKRSAEQSVLYYDSGKSATFDLNGKVYLFARETITGNTGYFSWDLKGGIVAICYGPKEMGSLMVSQEGDCLYTEQKYDAPPSLHIKRNKKPPVKIYQSNPQQDRFHWGKSELILHTNAKGRNLTSILYYPANYKSGEKYPMLVEVYQKRGRELHKYLNPSEYSTTGYKTTNFTSRGYFVLHPDIQYEIGDPGVSALDCTLAAITAVQEKVAIDEKRMGISGHSYGGYEVNFIITQTDIFRAALSGTGIADLSSLYLDYSRNYNRSEFWRFEYGSFSMGKSLFEDKVIYDRNSPIIHAPSIKTPLFSWTGAADTQVNPQQSMEFHLALKRLGKENVFIIYPDEDHTIHNKQNQFDITQKFEEWFDYYLKDGPIPEWTLPNSIKF